MPDMPTVGSASDPSAAARPRLLHLDGWRGLAIALVLVDHFVTIPGLELGSAGVDLFFVLSGRLIAEILFVERTPIPSFLVRRFARVYPSLLLFVLLVGPLHLAIGQPWPSFLPPLSFTANYVYAIHGEPRFFGHLWSLCVEEHSYLVLAALALWHRARGLRPAAIIAALAVCAFADLLVSEGLLGQHGFEVLWRTDARAGSLLASAGVYLALRRFPLDPSARPWLRFVPLAALCGAILLYADAYPEMLQYPVCGLLLAVSVNTLHHAPAWALRPLTSPAMLLLAQWSYSIYLWQQPIFVTAFAAHTVPRWVCLPVAIGVGIAACSLVERPARRGVNAWWEARGGWSARGDLQPMLRDQPLL